MSTPEEKREDFSDLQICFYCGKRKPSIYAALPFCGVECAHNFGYRLYASRWENGQESGRDECHGDHLMHQHAERHLLLLQRGRCSRCGDLMLDAKQRIVLNIHHRDGNRGNFAFDCVEAFCAQCKAAREGADSGCFPAQWNRVYSINDAEAIVPEHDWRLWSDNDLLSRVLALLHSDVRNNRR